MDARFEKETAQASFRGVPFYVYRRGRAGGRRGPTHEAPQRDEPDGEDLGRAKRSLRVEALIIGRGATDAAQEADCKRRSLALVRALEDVAGAGTYRDPWHGAWRVICRGFECTDDEMHIGISYFSITFEESGETRYPLVALDSATASENAAAVVVAAAIAAATAAIVLASQPQWVKAAAVALGTSALSGLAALSLSQLATTDAIGIGDASAALASAGADLTAELVAGTWAATLADAVRSVGSSSYSRRAGLGDAATARTAWAGLASWGDDLATVDTITASRTVQAANQAALVALVRRLAVTEEVRALAATTWDSYDQAVTQRDETLARIDTLSAAAADSGEDAVYAALVALAAAVTQDVATRAPEIYVRTTTQATSLPAVVLAYRLTGDATQADDLVKRNGVVHPLFMPGGVALEYLSNG